MSALLPAATLAAGYLATPTRAQDGVIRIGITLAHGGGEWSEVWPVGQR